MAKTKTKTKTMAAPAGDEPISLSEAIKLTTAYKTSDLSAKGGVVPILLHGYKFAPKSRQGSGTDWCKTTGFHKDVYELAEQVAAELDADDGDDES